MVSVILDNLADGLSVESQMSFRIKFNENLARTHRSFLASLGYDAVMAVLQ